MSESTNDLKVTGQLHDDVLRDEYVDFGEYNANVQTVNKGVAGIVNRYAEGRFNVHVHLQVGVGDKLMSHDRSVVDLCVVLERCKFTLCDNGEPAIAGESELATTDKVADHVNVVMLVPIRKRGEDGQEMGNGFIRSSVWLQTVEECKGICGHTPRTLLPISVGVRILLGILFDNRKFGSIGWLLPIIQDELTGKVVEGASEVVNNIADDDAEFRRRTFINACAYDIFLRFGVEFVDERVRVFAKERKYSSVKLVSVVFGPFRFQSDSTNVYHQVLSLPNDREERKADAKDEDGFRDSDSTRSNMAECD